MTLIDLAKYSVTWSTVRPDVIAELLVFSGECSDSGLPVSADDTMTSNRPPEMQHPDVKLRVSNERHVSACMNIFIHQTTGRNSK